MFQPRRGMWPLSLSCPITRAQWEHDEMTAEEKADLQAEMKAAMAKTREQNLKYIKENGLEGMIAAREESQSADEQSSEAT